MNLKFFLPLVALLGASPGFAVEERVQTWESPETQITLIELFSSEGCSSCPPAETWVGQLKTSANLWTGIVPVVFHVDYWDRLGWVDRFASKVFTKRQHRYSAAWGGDSVYTPGFVVNGREWRGWLPDDRLPAASSEIGGRLRVTVRDGTQAKVVLTPGKPPEGALRLEYARLGFGIQSKITRGENGGRALVHDFVVLEAGEALMKTETGSPNQTSDFSIAKRDPHATEALAVWVRQENSVIPIQATGDWLR